MEGNWDALVSGSIGLNFDVDETGVDLPLPDIAWTGTKPDGTLASATCNDWTSATSSTRGLTGATTDPSSKWTANGESACDQRAHLYCTEH